MPRNPTLTYAYYCSIFFTLVFASARTGPALAEPIASDAFANTSSGLLSNAGGIGWKDRGPWKATKQFAPSVDKRGLTYELTGGKLIGTGGAVLVQGTRQLNNPLRRQLQRPYSGETLYVRFLMRYQADGIDDAAGGDGEFFILWLDDLDGGDGAVHNADVPNVGVRIDDGRGSPSPKNRFMARIGGRNTAFSQVELEGDRTYMLVVKLTKSRPYFTDVYDRLELWINPDPADDQRMPDAVVYSGNLNMVRWVGFSTGRKTEPEDRIWIDELVLGERWADVFPLVTAKDISQPPSSQELAQAEELDFRRHVYPILRDRCFGCHQGREAESGYRLDVREEILGHLQGRPLAIPGNSRESPLIQALLTEDEETRMPQGDQPLPEDEIAVLRKWIDQGLAWDDELLPPASVESEHWAFQPVVRPNIPHSARTGWGRNPVDAFITARHDELGIEPARPASPRTLIRRLALVLTGLPPRPSQVQAFVGDHTDEAYARLIDRLLASRDYGERWGRHWLDVARWAESDGYQHNTVRPHAWRYRDYVVSSFQENKPFDQFVREQVAGDELLPFSGEHLIATGFLAGARYSGNEMDKEIQRNDILVDITNATASALLGLTMACAQCHSHKFDPISARDYYRFQGFFVKGQPGELVLRRGKNRTRQSDRGEIKADRATAAEPESSGAAGRRTAAEGLSAEPLARTWGYYSPATSPQKVEVARPHMRNPLPYKPEALRRARPVLLVRGDLNNAGPVVDVGWPAVFGATPTDGRIDQRPRTALAEWLTSRSNPLTARVWVNRIWQHHFGRGLVATPNNFGLTGAEPSHPQLLDWLAAELMDAGWDTNHIHRLILQSSTFRESSEFSEESAEVDGGNQFYWRWQVRRLEAEVIRDSMLAVSGMLDSTIGGPSVPLDRRDESRRKTLYLLQKRAHMPTVQQMFDGPSSMTSCGYRRTSTVALQPLYLLNNPQMVEYAQAFAARVAEEAGSDVDQQIKRAVLIALGRELTEEEFRHVLQYMKAGENDAGDIKPTAGEGKKHNVAARRLHPPESHRRLVQFCHALLNLNEFNYIP